jgi:transcriptional regulator with XRE-family HTH domain
VSTESNAGNRLAELRQARDWRRSVVAAEFNLSEKTIYRWESGEQPIPSDVIPTLAALFDVSEVHLMGWDREPTPTSKAAA